MPELLPSEREKMQNIHVNTKMAHLDILRELGLTLLENRLIKILRAVMVELQAKPISPPQWNQCPRCSRRPFWGVQPLVIGIRPMRDRAFEEMTAAGSAAFLLCAIALNPCTFCEENVIKEPKNFIATHI